MLSPTLLGVCALSYCICSVTHIIVHIFLRILYWLRSKFKFLQSRLGYAQYSITITVHVGKIETMGGPNRRHHRVTSVNSLAGVASIQEVNSGCCAGSRDS